MKLLVIGLLVVLGTITRANAQFSGTYERMLSPMGPVMVLEPRDIIAPPGAERTRLKGDVLRVVTTWEQMTGDDQWAVQQLMVADFDDSGRESLVRSEAPDGFVEFEYTIEYKLVEGRVMTETVWGAVDDGGGPLIELVTTYQYDDKGLVLLQTTDADGELIEEIRVERNQEAGGLVAHTLEGERHEFDADNRVVRWYLGEPGEFQEFNWVDPRRAEISRTYDGETHHDMTIQLDELGSITDFILADEDQPYPVYGDSRRAYDYDEHGNWTLLSWSFRAPEGEDGEWIEFVRIHREITYR